MAKKDTVWVDPSLGPLNLVVVGGEKFPWAQVFPRNYDVIFNHPRPLVPEYRPD